MSEVNKITNLKIILTPGNSIIHFTGNVSVVEARSLLDKFKDITNFTNVMNTREIKENNDVKIAENIDNNAENINNNEIKDEIIDLEDNDDFVFSRYQIIGQPMPLNNIDVITVTNSWRTFSSILIESSQPRVPYRNKLSYRILFPYINNTNFPEISVNNGVLSELFEGHSYPVCSCPSYYYRSYTIQYNNIRLNGLCKHIDDALKSLNIETKNINWLNRPDNLPYLLKTEGLNEYQWLPTQ